MNDDDARPLAFLDVGKSAGAAVKDNLAFVGSVGVHTRQHLHQRRFPRAVLADQRVNLAPLYPEIDIIQRLHARKCLGDVFHLKQG